MAETPTLSQTKDNEVFIGNQPFPPKQYVAFGKRYSNVMLFLVLIFAVAFILTSDYLWHRFNHTKLGSVIKLDVGRIQGVVLTELGVTAEYFIGVPFAEPPIGDNRFEKTVPVKPWSDTKETIKPEQHCSSLIYGSDQSEDCLYLNIARPLNRSGELLPVLFSVHGGAFQFGGANLYGMYDNRGLSLLKSGIILVSIQYRLAVFGFASTGTKELPGSLGYFDQAEALSFIHRNCKSIGCDPDRITILGQSAGGASVTALSISPYTRNFVHQAIALSGSAFAAWATSDAAVNSTGDLLQVLGQKTGETAKERLKRATTTEIYNAINTIGTTHFSQNFGVYMPRIDGDFFSKDLPDLIEEALKKSIIIGLTSEESLSWTLFNTQNTSGSKIVIPVSKRASFSEKDLELLIQELVLEKFYGNKTQEVRQKILNFYSQSNSVDKDNVFYLQRYTQLFSDLQFNVPVLWEILLRGHYNWTVFAYNSPYFDKNNIPVQCPVKESYHGSDQHYANPVLDCDHLDESADDIKMEIQTIKWLISYIKTGNPSTPDFEWKPTSASSPLQFANLIPKPESKSDLFIDRAKFWTELTRQYDYDFVRMTYKKKNIDVQF